MNPSLVSSVSGATTVCTVNLVNKSHGQINIFVLKQAVKGDGCNFVAVGTAVKLAKFHKRLSCNVSAVFLYDVIEPICAFFKLGGGKVFNVGCIVLDIHFGLANYVLEFIKEQSALKSFNKFGVCTCSGKIFGNSLAVSHRSAAVGNKVKTPTVVQPRFFPSFLGFNS